MSKRQTPTCPTCGLTDLDDAVVGRCDHGPRTTMLNLAMARKLMGGEALDVRAIGHPVAGQPGLYVLDRFEEGKDYCDAESEEWVWSIGRLRAPIVPSDEAIYAATDGRFYQNPKFECLWLR